LLTGVNDEVLRRGLRQLEGGWRSNIALDRSKQRALFPTAGALQRLSLSSTIPGGDVQYASADYLAQQFFRLPLIPIVNRIPISATLHASYAMPFGKTTTVLLDTTITLPAGGRGDLRGER
jgi:outer membrane protein assembly factor BamA